MTIHEDLVAAIRSRKTTPHNRGIVSADRYVKTLQDCVGSDICYRYAATKSQSFADLIKASQKSLTYNDPGMTAEDIYSDFKSLTITGPEGDVVDLPKKTLMVFKHVLTTPRKDRDGDVLHSKGAVLDPKMLLLWQHVHTLPIGKMLGVVEHNEKQIVVVSAIVDMNDLAHDAAVMIDSKMGRFSHGFRATKFSKIKEESGKTSGGGFEVKEFEVMEESLVSVPANPDADTLEIYLDLIEGEKLTSPMMKQFGTSIREKRPLSVVTGYDENSLKGEDENELETKSGCGCSDDGKRGGKPCGCDGCAAKRGESPPEKADDSTDDKDGDDGKAEDKKGVNCPKCDIKLIDGECPDCGYKTSEKPEGKPDDKPKPKKPPFGGKDDEEKDKDADDITEKGGRVLSKSLYGKMQSVAEDLKEIGGHCSTRSGKALCGKCAKTVDEVLKAAERADTDQPKASGDLTTKDMAAAFLTEASPEELNTMRGVLGALKAIDEQTEVTESFREAINN